jgi:diguanylate cyclase (GGDEF)-like protein
LRRAKRNRLPVALIMLDVDRFKNFNDTYGHAAGDSLLQAVANSLQASVRSNDVVCRYGGDEFCVAMPESSLENAVMWARKRKSTARYLRIDWQGQTLGGPTFSMGVAAFPACPTLDALFMDADSALYSAKAGGRDRVKPGPSSSLSSPGDGPSG